MCGICGKIDFTGIPVDEALLQRMTSSLIHRGPDDAGIRVSENVGLGHRRLSIIDLSPHAHQPMCNEDGTVWIVFNGEIYNFLDLRRDLMNNGHIFRSKSDTETIIHLYEEYGTDCLQYLRGMFAFAIWDERDRSLFLARDRIGKKPLYYYFDGKTFIFGSEIKAILADQLVERLPDHEAIHHYLTYQYVPSPWTAFKGIRKLPPAHYLLLRNGEITIERYWNISYLPKLVIKEKDLRHEILERLKEAIRIRLISDVPLGAFLSGGIDSSAVVALMAGIMKEPVKTFSIGFREEAYNELKFARMVADRYKTDHTEFMVEPDAVDILPKLVWHYNEPFADPSAIPTYYVSKLAREHVTVILNGDGGDENFAGYGRYALNAFSEKVRKVFPAFLVKALQPLFMLLPHGGNPNNFVWRLKRFSQTYVRSPERRNADMLLHFMAEMKSELYTEAFREEVSGTDSFDLLLAKFREAGADNLLERTLYSDVMMYLPDALLVKVDVASMANALEARSPFLDHEFMELPDEVLFREKMGFGVPLDYWFRNELKAMAYDTLLGQRAMGRGYFNRDYVREILDDHVSGKWNWQYHIFNLLMLELWHREFIDAR